MNKRWISTKELTIAIDIKGLTLLEVMLTVSIITIIFVTSMTLLLSGIGSWDTNKVKVELNQEIRKAMDWMSQELRQAGTSEVTLNNSVPADGSTKTSISFKKAVGVNSGGSIIWSDDAIQFFLGGTESNQLQRQAGAVNRIISQNIKTLQFSRQSSTPEVLEVSLQAEKNNYRGDAMNVSLDFKVQLRN